MYLDRQSGWERLGKRIGRADQDNRRPRGMWFEGLQVDGKPAGAFPIGQVIFNSNSVTVGWHSLTVTSQSINPGSKVLGSASVVLNVVNGVPTPTPTPSGPHYSMQGPGAALPSEAFSCAQQVNAFPIIEFAPWNQNDGTGYNSNQPPAEPIPSYFYTYAPGGSALPSSDFAKLDGAYAGATDDIFRFTLASGGSMKTTSAPRR